jgi:hypothetical protein
MSSNEIVKFDDYKKEFYEEIRSINVKLEDLQDLKIPDKVFASEIALRRVFGDEISFTKFADVADGEEKTISKLDAQDIEFDASVRDVCERVVDPEFDSEVDLLKASMLEEEL